MLKHKYVNQAYHDVQGCQIGLFRPNLRNLASFQVGRPKDFSWPFDFFWPHLKLAALKNVLGLLALLWPFLL